MSSRQKEKDALKDALKETNDVSTHSNSFGLLILATFSIRGNDSSKTTKPYKWLCLRGADMSLVPLLIMNLT